MIAEEPIGSELLGYRIETALGRGGMGVVYLAEDLRLKRRVALKLLSPELAENEVFRERLLAESELAASLDHPNIVPVYQAGEADGRIFISMRYVEGKDLRERLRSGPLDAEQTVALVSQIAGALDAAHARGLVHGDVKPSNVLIAPGEGPRGSDHVYLADFGLTRRLSESEARTPGIDQLLGTIAYVAPEQIRGERVDGRADVYSLGCLLYECLAGAPPFPHESDAAILFAHLQEEPPSLPGLEQVLATALAKSPDDRYQTCRELADVVAVALGVGRRPRRRGAKLVVAGVGLLAVAALAVFLTRSQTAGASTGIGRLVRIDTATNTRTKTIAIGQDPTGVAVGSGFVWMTSLPDSSVWRLDPRTMQTKRISISGPVLGIAVTNPSASVPQPAVTGVGEGVAYVSGVGGVVMVDPQSGQRTGAISIGDTTAIGVGPSGVWASGNKAYRLTDVSFGVGKVTESVAMALPSLADETHSGADQTGVAVGKHAVWLLGDAIDRRLFRIDPSTGRVVDVVRLGFAPGGVAVGFGSVWVTDQLDDRLVRIDPVTERVSASIAVGRAPWGVVTGAGSVWTANTVDGTVSRIDPGRNRIVATIAVGASPKELAVGSGAVWAASTAR